MAAIGMQPVFPIWNVDHCHRQHGRQFSQQQHDKWKDDLEAGLQQHRLSAGHPVISLSCSSEMCGNGFRQPVPVPAVLQNSQRNQQQQKSKRQPSGLCHGHDAACSMRTCGVV